MEQHPQKIWLVTGISSGLGKALAEHIIDQNDILIGTVRCESDANWLKDKTNGEAFLMDITQEKDIERVVAHIKKKHGRVDVLVNNAGFGMAGAVEETSSEEARQLFETNFFGALHLTQSILPLMRQQGAGHLMFVSSHTGFKAFPGFGLYSASKFALEAIGESIAGEVAPLGIKTTIVEPGPFRTGFAGKGFVLSEKSIDDYAATAGAFRQKIKAVDGKQEGNPAKAAEVIYTLTQMEHPPLRQPLGKMAVATIESKLNSMVAELEKTRNTAERAVF